MTLPGELKELKSSSEEKRDLVMSSEPKVIEPIKTSYRVNFLDDQQLDDLQEATLGILESTGVQFRSTKALAVLAEHGAKVDHDSQIVKIPRDLIHKAMSTVPRYFALGARNPDFDLQLQDGVSYLANDGCGHSVVDFETGERRVSHPCHSAGRRSAPRIAGLLPRSTRWMSPGRTIPSTIRASP
jgi:trimethylamine:corrinoid methyltransferase-like protein